MNSSTASVGASSQSGGQRLRHVARAELIKLLSLRSTWALLGSGAVVCLASASLSAIAIVAHDRTEGSPPSDFDAVSVSVVGVSTMVFLFAMVAVIQVTSELTTGLGRATFASVPRRPLIVMAKAAAFGAVAAPAAAVCAAMSVIISQAILATRGLNIDVLSGNAAQLVVGTGALAFAFGVFSQTLGWILRSTVGAAFALLALQGLLSSLVGLLLPRRVLLDVVPYLPAEAANAMTGADPSEAPLSGVAALAMTVLWCAAALALSIRVLRSRDV